jgi:hypothetical protein
MQNGENMDSPTLEIPAIGQYWVGQGGIYVGQSILGGYLIAAEKPLDGEFEFGGYGDKLPGYSDRDGAANTDKLIERGNHPAAIAARGFEADGHSDFFLPAHRQAIQRLAVFGFGNGDEYEWTSTPCGSDDAWVVDFEHGGVRTLTRYYEFRVRPFRLINLPI